MGAIRGPQHERGHGTSAEQRVANIGTKHFVTP
jgi:hypothetical protein